MNLTGRPTNPGELRTQVSLQSRSNTAGSGGFQVPTWTTFATAWVKWENLHGPEVWQAETVQAVQPATVWMRYNASLDNSCAILKNGVRYEIVSLDNVRERGEYVEIKVRRMAGG